MKKFFLIFICILFSIMNCFALDKATVRVRQYAKIGNGQWAEMSSPELPIGEIVNLKYEFTVDAKDDAHACIDCILRFPEELVPQFVSASGVQALKLENDGTVAALTHYNERYKGMWCKSFEFLIPQKKAGGGYVELQVKIPQEFSGKSIHVDCCFEHFRRPFILRHLKAIGIATGIATGIVVGVLTFNPATGAAAGAAAGTATVATTTGLSVVGSVALGTGVGLAVAGGTALGEEITYSAIKNTIQDMREKYSSYKMNDSYTVFTLKIRQ
ncbi:MAG: hypothetical protein VZR56_02130 [Treponema sp.]|nr:hypothetical protein [Treponema sp.]